MINSPYPFLDTMQRIIKPLATYQDALMSKQSIMPQYSNHLVSHKCDESNTYGLVAPYSRMKPIGLDLHSDLTAISSFNS